MGTLCMVDDYIAFDYTLVLYKKDDIVSEFLALWSLYPIGVLIFYFSWFISTREIEPCIIAGGQVINDIINIFLKKMIKFNRPNTIHGDGYGMPSAHSQFTGFLTIYFTMRLIYQFPTMKILNKILIFVYLTSTSILIMFSRYYLKYHHLEQIIVGCLLGSFLGFGYFIFVSILRDIGIIRWLLSWKICDFLYMKDTIGENSDSFKQQRERWLENTKNTQ
ncbi:hypothetical protein BVG19_g3276 [[Candida] boidinii]|nr:hypothetical protein BVG19_g3276 [[Candida] boidinii]OWB49482.1 hypothetical protein B5S27_g1023 [[Candida] boidinii]